jgi:tetratricopeptide (TPR) repeat protein
MRVNTLLLSRHDKIAPIVSGQTETWSGFSRSIGTSCCARSGYRKLKAYVRTASFLLLFFNLCAFAEEDITIGDVREFLASVPTRQEIGQTITELKQSIRENPHNYSFYEMLALVYEYIGEYDKALKALKAAVSYSSESSEGKDSLYGSIARVYIKLKKFDEANPAIYKAVALNPANLNNLQYLISYYIAKNMYKEAAEQLREISTRDKNKDYYYHFYLYAEQDLKKKGSEIIELFKAAAKANPKSNMAHRTLAVVLRNHSTNIKKDFPKIISELKKAFSLNKKYIFTYISFGDTYMVMGLETGKQAYFKKALAWFNKAYKREPDNVKLNLAMGVLFLNTGQYDKAIAKFEYVRARAEDETVIDNLVCAYNNKADFYCKKGENLEEGLKAVEEALKLKPQDSIALTTKAEILYKQQRFKEAYACIKEAFAISPRNATIMQHFKNMKKTADEAPE